MSLLTSTYVAPKFFKNPYIQTLYSIYLRRVSSLPYKREKIITPDRDFLYLDWVYKDPRKLVILTHGIAGDSNAIYTRGMAKAFADANWSVLAWNMRGRGSNTTNWQEKNYHLGFTEDIRFVTDYANEQKKFDQIVLIGFSMGANIGLKFIGEDAHQLNPAIKGSIAFSAPIDAVSCGDKIDQPAHRLYSGRMLREFIEPIVKKISLLSPRIDVDRLLKVKTWREFDEIYTAPLYGFDSVYEYRKKASAKLYLSSIQIPTLLVNAKDDPILSEECFPTDEQIQNHPHLFCEFPKNGGHLGFVSFDSSGYVWSEKRSLEFANSLLKR